MNHSALIVIVHQPRKPGATEQNASEAAHKITNYRNKARFKNIRIERKRMKPISTVCVLATNCQSIIKNWRVLKG